MLEALTNSELVENVTTQGFLSDKQYGIPFSRLTTDVSNVLLVIAENICQPLDKNGEALIVPLDISNVFEV